MIKKEKAICCKIEGCQGKGRISQSGTEIFALGYCNKHYLRLKRHDNLFFGDNKERITCCSIEGCEGKGTINRDGTEIFSLGYCKKHYQRIKKHNDPLYFKEHITCCSIEGCKDKHEAKGYCAKHYQRIKKHDDPLYEEEHATCCKIEGCQGKGTISKNGLETFKKGFCEIHYRRFRVHGDPLIVKHIRGEDREKNPLYCIYQAIKQRCYDKNCKSYKNYGIRGICMCDEWLSDFNVFLKDMGERPKGYSIDRIDVNGNYCKENCKWSNWHQQQGNTRRNNEIVGVYWNKQTKKWYARITIKKETIRLGNFVNYEDACVARRDAEILYNVYNEKT